MRYRLSISEAAIEQLRALPGELRRNIGFRIESLCEDLQGDVKKLKGSPPR
jgi:mRNA-degrading endonuclease RelE of RelBE toxin-antitoxin system